MSSEISSRSIWASDASTFPSPSSSSSRDAVDGGGGGGSAVSGVGGGSAVDGGGGSAVSGGGGGSAWLQAQSVEHLRAHCLLQGAVSPFFEVRATVSPHFFEHLSAFHFEIDVHAWLTVAS
jgi:hypothetical protein